MRTANNTNNYTVEGLVAKYRNFVKENTPEWLWLLFKNFDYSNDLSSELAQLEHVLYADLSFSNDATKEEKKQFEVEIMSRIDQYYPGCTSDHQFVNIVINRLLYDVRGKLVDYVDQHMKSSNADVQLIAKLYRIVASEKANSCALDALSAYTELFNPDVYDKEEFDFLCKHFSEVISYEMSNKKDWVGTTMEEWFYDTGVPETRLSTEFKNYLKTSVNAQHGNVLCVIDAFDMSDFALSYPKALYTGPGYFGVTTALEQIRLYSETGIKYNTTSFGDFVMPPKKSVDFIIFDALRYEYSNYTNFRYEEIVEQLYESLKDGGKMLFLITRNGLLCHLKYKFKNNQMVDFYKRIVNECAIKSMILFEKDIHVAPAGPFSYVDFFSMEGDQDNILFIIEKKKHSFVNVEDRRREKTLTVKADSLDASFLFPGYYLACRPMDGCPLSSLAKPDNNSDGYRYGDSLDKALVVTPQNLSEDYKDACILFKSLSTKAEYLNNPNRGVESISYIDNPGVLFYANEEKLFIGYISDQLENGYIRSRSVLYLIPEKGVDVRYLAALLISPEVQQQIVSCYAGMAADRYNDYLSLFLDRIIVPNHSPEERLQFLSDANYEALMSTQQELKKNHEDYKKAVRMRKHALTQSLSSIEAVFYALNAYRLQHEGKLSDRDIISRRKGTTVQDAFDFIEPSLKNMMVTLEHIADVEYNFGNIEGINPEEFIEDYIAKHENGWLNFKPIVTWEKGHNLVANDVIDPKTGNVILRKGTPAHQLHFAKDALEHIFNNIISNAVAHGFTDVNRKDYQLQFSWYSDGIALIVEIDNNGTPIPANRDTASLLEYGVSTALHTDGHNGIGCNEIDDIMRRYGGKVELVSTPDEEFTVKYILTFRS